MKSPIIYKILYLFFFLTPMESVSIIQGGDFSLPKMAVLLLLLVYLLRSSWNRLYGNAFIGVIGLYSVWALITSVFSINMEGSMSRFVSFLVPLLVLIYILNTLVTNDKVIRNIMLSFVAGCCIPICIMIYFTMQGVGGELNRMTAFEQDQNELSVMLSIAASFVFILLKDKNPKIVNLLLVIFICFCFVAILLTGSRTGFIILMAVLLLGLLSLGKKGIIWAIISIFLILPFLLPYIPESNVERLLQTQEQVAQGDFTGRGYVWQRGLAAFHTQLPIRMLIGVGYDQFQFLYNQNYGTFTAPHNTYLAIYVELGIIGFAIFLYILYYVFRKTMQLCRSNRTLVYLGMFLPLIIAMMTLGLQTRRWLWIILFLIYKIYSIDKFKRIENIRR